MISQLTVNFEPANGQHDLNMRSIPVNKLHGLLFKTILPAADPGDTDWLHNHVSPKPFTLTPCYGSDDQLIGLRLSSLSERASELLASGWQTVYETGEILHLGQQNFRVTGVVQKPKIEFSTLVLSPPKRQMTLRFRTPTAFKQGPLRLHLPLPKNVFARPAQMWQMYAPDSLSLPSGWLDWCEEHIFVKHHNIRTVSQPLNQRSRFTGFVGWSKFATHSDDDLKLRLWHALGKLATFCGVGYKTTMGMGAVD